MGASEPPPAGWPLTGDIERLLAAARVLAETTQQPVVVIGGIARSVWATPRSTLDLDVVYGGARIDEVVAAASAIGLVAVPEEVAALSLASMTRLRLPDQPTGPVRLDVLEACHPYYRRLIDRSRVLEQFGAWLRFACPEDVILLKLLADRPQDRLDVQAIIEAQGERLDLAVLHNEAKALQLELPETLAGSGAG